MQKRFSGGAKEWLLIVVGTALLLVALLLPLRYALADDLTTEERQLLKGWQTGEIIRIHVIANSDTSVDQALKLKVRDALIDAFGDTLATAGQTDYETASSMLESSVELMRKTAQACVIQNGFECEVRAEYGLLHLPEKRYGSVLLPEGDYNALRVTLGEGKGQNWWCVLYPQLCLALSENTAEEKADLYWSSKRIFRCWLLMGE